MSAAPGSQPAADKKPATKSNAAAKSKQPLAKAEKPDKEKYKVHIYVALSVSVVLLVGLALYLALAYEKAWFPFNPYTKPPLPGPAFNPLGVVTKLTAEQQQQRKQAIDNSSAQG